MLTSKILLMAAAISGIVNGAPASNVGATAALDISDGPGPNMVPFNTTMPDGSVEVVWLHEAFQPVAGPVQEPRRIEERLKWNPNGTPNQCGDSTFVDRTTTGSPAQIDCEVCDEKPVSRVSKIQTVTDKTLLFHRQLSTR